MTHVATRKKVIIIGAGIGGLATANLLAKAGYQVVVYEQLDGPGGRAGILKQDGFTFDTGPSWYLMPEVFEHYFELLGHNISEQLHLRQLKPAYKVFYEDTSSITITSDLDKDAALFEAREPGAGEALKRYVAKSSDIYTTAMQHFLYTNFARTKDMLKPAIVRRAATLLRMSFTPLHQYVKKFVRTQQLQQILEYPMVFLGASPFQAPALYSLMSALDFTEGVYYPDGGLYTIIQRLEAIGKELGVTYHYKSDVAHITTQEGRATGIKLSSGNVVEADIVISNADIHYTEQNLLQKKDRSYSPHYWKKMHAGPSAILVYLGINKKLPQLEHHNLLFVKQWKENFEAIENSNKPPVPASMYVCNPSKSDTSVAPKGCENLFVLIPIPSATKLSTKELEDTAQQYIAQLEQTAGIAIQKHIVTKQIYGPAYFEQLLRSHKASMLGPAHILRQSAFFRTKNYSKKVRDLYFVGGTTTPGIGLPMCLIGAEMVLKRISGDTSSGRLTKIPRRNGGSN